jgi:predicted SnoaL-like aldol condensation-catalyzing enzyme
LEDYTEISVIFTPKGTVKGLNNIRRFFEEFFAVIPTGSVFGMNQKLVEGNVAYIVWNSESNSAQIPVGTDTFVFKDDKIKYHTVADYRVSK